jgi:hypothetical protein
MNSAIAERPATLKRSFPFVSYLLSLALLVPFGTMVWPAPTLAAVVLCGVHESPIDCQKRADQEAADQKAYLEAVKTKVEFNQEIAAVRAKFWATYPDKPGAQAAREKFAEMLRQKDLYYLILNQYPQNAKLTREAGPGAVADLFDRYVGGINMDNGIPRAVRPEFFEWAEAFRRNLNAAGGLFTFQAATNAFKALAASRKEYDQYILARDWAEFDAVNRIPAGYELPRNYAAMLYFRFGHVPIDAAFANIATMVKLLGLDAVESAARLVMAAPKTHEGGLVVNVPEPIKIGPGGNKLRDDTVPAPQNVIGSFGGQLSAFEALATRGDDRRYLLALAADNVDVPRNPSRHIGKWDRAANTYQQYVYAFGEPQVIAAAHQVRVATKRMTDGSVMDPKAIGSTRTTPFSAFQDVLARKDPRGYVRSMLAFNRGVKSKAELDSAYRDFVATNGETTVLETARKMAAGRPDLELDFDQLGGALNGSISLDTPPQAMVDDWQYLSWKGFSSGANASYVFHGLAPDRPGSTNMVPGPATVRSTFKLQSIKDDQAQLWLTEISYDYPSGRAHPPHDTEIYYAPQRPATLANPARQSTVESGEEVLTIQGKKLATRWQSITESTAPCPRMTKIWISDQVPGGIVRQLQQMCQGPRAITRETLLESFEGTRQGGFTDIFEPRPRVEPAPTASAPPGGGLLMNGKAGAIGGSLPSVPQPAPGGTPTGGKGGAIGARAGNPGPAPQPPPSANAPVAQPDPPNPEFPNYDLTDHKAAESVVHYCHDIYDPPFPLLSTDQVKFAYANRAAIDTDVKNCVSWFDLKQIMANRKLAMRYCLLSHDYFAPGAAAEKAAYDSCMNQNDILTALCTAELKNRTQLNRKKGIGEMDAACPGTVPRPGTREYFVVKFGDRQDFGRFTVPAAGPGLPTILQGPLPSGLLHSGGAA